MVELTSDNPQDISYYFSTILLYFVTLILINAVIYFYKSTSRAYKTRKLSDSLDIDVEYSQDFIQKKNYLKVQYLSAYILSRAAMWAKAPYLYILYNKYFNFTVSEISILYVIDAISGLITGPIFGSLADKYGRKLFSLMYCIFVMTNLCLRLTGIKGLAIIAQILTGFGSGLINSTFESWLVYEANKVFEDKLSEKEKYLKRLFKNQNLLDAIISLVVSVLAASIFTYFGIISTIFFSIFLSGLSFFVILFLWDENKPNKSDAFNENSSSSESFKAALQELKNFEVLGIGIIESFFQACLNLFIFAWTPILQRSTIYLNINVGFIFVCFVIVMVLGTAFFNLFVITMRSAYYKTMSIFIILNTSLWYLIYFIDSFYLRFFFLSIINGMCGFYGPLNSIIKSKILVEKHRATLMNIFRIPVNLYVIISLLSLKYLDVFTICIITACMMTFASIIAVLLYLLYKDPSELLELSASINHEEDLTLDYDEDKNLKMEK